MDACLTPLIPIKLHCPLIALVLQSSDHLIYGRGGINKGFIDLKSVHTDIWKVTSGGRAEIENVRIISSYFQFQFCHQAVLFNSVFTFLIYCPSFEKGSARFLIGCAFIDLASWIASTLNFNLIICICIKGIGPLLLCLVSQYVCKYCR